MRVRKKNRAGQGAVAEGDQNWILVLELRAATTTGADFLPRVRNLGAG
jgi:hypothetical protein